MAGCLVGSVYVYGYDKAVVPNTVITVVAGGLVKLQAVYVKQEVVVPLYT